MGTDASRKDAKAGKEAFGGTPNAARETRALPFFNSDGKPFISAHSTQQEQRAKVVTTSIFR
jgi:hypothetical protein